MSLTESKTVVYVNSAFRVSGTHSDFLYNLDLGTNNYDHAVVMQASIPKSYYLVQANHNTFTLDENGTLTTVTLPAGNYTRTSLRSVLQTLLNSVSPNMWTYAITIPSSSNVETGKFTFTVSNNGGIQPSFIFQSNNIAQILGFEKNSTNIFVGDVLVSVNVINLQKETTLYLHADFCTNGSDNILQEIFGVDSPTFSNITYQCIDVELCSKVLQSNMGSIVRFWLTDENDLPIDLNGQNIVMSILLYKRESTSSLLKNVLKLSLLKEK